MTETTEMNPDKRRGRENVERFVTDVYERIRKDHGYRSRFRRALSPALAPQIWGGSDGVRRHHQVDGSRPFHADRRFDRSGGCRFSRYIRAWGCAQSLRTGQGLQFRIKVGSSGGQTSAHPALSIGKGPRGSAQTGAWPDSKPQTRDARLRASS